MNKKGALIVIVAPSGTGKSTLIEKIKKDFPQIGWSVSCTTRPIRVGEIHGINYFYLTVAEFEAKISTDDFIEWAKVHSNYYGTSKEFVNNGLDSGKFLLFDVDVQGADNLKKYYKNNAHVIFIEPPSIEELEKRLRKRATDSEKVIEERVKNAKKEMLRKDDYDYLVMNDDVSRAYESISTIIKKIITQ